MGFVRAAVRAVLVAAATGSLFALLLLGRLALAGWPEASRKWRRWILRAWGRSTCALVGVRQEVRGDLPRGGGLLVTNHLSYLDIPLLAGRLGAVFVSKAEVADWPVIGMLARAGGTVFLERERKRRLPEVNRLVARLLEEGELVVVFPEGTSTDGSRLERFRPSLLEPAAASGVEVRYAALAYRTQPPDPPASLAVCWWGGMEFLPHVLRLGTLRRIEARLVFGAGTVREADRKLLAEKLWRAVNECIQSTA